MYEELRNKDNKLEDESDDLPNLDRWYIIKAALIFLFFFKHFKDNQSLLSILGLRINTCQFYYGVSAC